MDFKRKYDGLVELINRKLDELVVEIDSPEKTMYSAMRYSLMAGGKRLRPVLALAVCEMLGGKTNEVLDFACAIEMIHAYSLIHDDLPAMDNDDYRRGKLTNHKVFGEAMAILAGDALLNYAYEVMLRQENSGSHWKAAGIIARASGVSGMIGGQVVDLESEGKEIPENILLYMHKSKTGALIKASVVASAVLSGAADEELNILEEFAEKLGLAFQIKDDILDVEGNLETMGKETGSDISNNKSTFVALFGLEKSKNIVCDLTNQAVDAIGKYGEKALLLKMLAENLAKREK